MIIETRYIDISGSVKLILDLLLFRIYRWVIFKLMFRSLVAFILMLFPRF